MIQEFVDRFMAKEKEIKASLADKHPEDYDELVKKVIRSLKVKKVYGTPSEDNLTVIDHGQYFGTRLYIVAEGGYSPDKYWYICVNYGSCSGCDTLEAIRMYGYNPPKPEQIQDYWTLMLHMIQNMKQLEIGAW